MITRSFRALLFIVAGTAACDSRTERAAQTSSLTVLYPADERSWAFYMPSQFLVFVPLAYRGRDGNLHGWLARSWEHSDDWRSWTVYLRSDARWHDGVPVTAADVKFSMELLAHPAVGAGPYRYVRHVPKTMMEFAANPDYFLGKPRIERIVLKYGEPSVAELLSGGADAIPWIQEMDLLKLRGDERFSVYSAVKPDHIHAVIWNHRNPLFADAAVRRALTLAIDRRALMRALNLPGTVPVFDVLFTHDQFYRGEVPAGLRYDLPRAKALLESAGWRDSNGGGVRERDGKTFRFTALVQPDQSFARAAVFIQSQLSAAGVRMDIRTLDAAVAAERVQRGEFDAAIWVVNNAIEGGSGHLDYFGFDSRIGYKNAPLAALLDSARAAFDRRQLDRLYRATVPIFEAELPVTFLYPLVRTTVARRWLKGLSTPYREDPLWYAGELWIE